jgi:hypothetical protein
MNARAPGHFLLLSKIKKENKKKVCLTLQTSKKRLILFFKLLTDNKCSFKAETRTPNRYVCRSKDFTAKLEKT